MATDAELRAAARRGCPDHPAPPRSRCAARCSASPPRSTATGPAPFQVRYIHTRDRTCRHPGCANKAAWSDGDHVVPHADGGPTTCQNLCCLCRRHHRLKTHAPGWHYVMAPDGTLTVTTPSGVTRTSRPPGHRGPPTRRRPAALLTMPGMPSWFPQDAAARVYLAGAAQQRQEHRVGAVPVRPQLDVRAARQIRARRAQRRGRRQRPTSPRAAGTSTTTPAVSARCGEHVTYATTPPGRTAPAPRASSSRCSRASAGRSPACRRQRASGRRRSAPSPVHGASSSTRSKPARQAGSRPVGRPRTSTSTGSPHSAGRTSPARCGARSTAVSRRRAGRPARRAAPPCRPARRTGRASGRPGPPAVPRRARAATSWQPSSWT